MRRGRDIPERQREEGGRTLVLVSTPWRRGRCWLRRTLDLFFPLLLLPLPFLSRPNVWSPPRHFLFTAAVRIKGKKREVHETSTVRDECPPAAPISGGERRGRERGSDVCFEYRYSRFVSAGAAAVVSRRPSSFLFLPSLLSFDRETPTFCFFFFFFLYSPSLAAAPHFYLIRKREVKV